MLRISEKQLIKNQLDKLKCDLDLFNKVSSDNFTSSNCVSPYKSPSLKIWCAYEQFFNNILFDYITKKEYDILEQIYDFLELDTFIIDAKESLENSKRKINDYIKRIEKRLSE